MLIRNESEWRESQVRLADFREQAQRVRRELAQRGLGEEAVSIATASQDTMADDIAWEIELYERLKAGDVDAVPNFAPEERGKALICLRIIKGWTQRQLAETLGVTEAVVSRDERNEYHGISLEKYGKVLAALGFVDHPRFAVKNDMESVVQRRTMIIQFPSMWRQAASFVPAESINISPKPSHTQGNRTMLDQDWLKTFAPFGIIPEQNRWQPTGACVFITYEDVVWCITAAHVLTTAASKPVGCMVTMNGQQTIIALSEIFAKTPGISWNIDRDNDLAVGPMPMPPGIDIRSIGFDRCLEQKDLLPSMPCLTAGQPYGLPGVDPSKPTPLILDGIIAGLEPERRRVFVSVPTFPGNSGGPIIAYRTPWNTAGGMNVGIPIVYLAGIITQTIVLSGNQADKNPIPPLHLGSGASFDAVRQLLMSEGTGRMLGIIRQARPAG